MPFVLIGVGLVLVLSGIKGDPNELYQLVTNDFAGKNNYLYWMLAILVLGSLGYVKKLEPFSRMFIVLVVVVLFIHNKGFFEQFQSQVFGKSQNGVTTQ